MQDTNNARISPLLPPDWDEEILDALGAFPSGLQFVLSRWENGGDDARGMHTLGSLAHYPALAKAFLTFNRHVAQNSTLSARERELLILRISWLRHSEYEFVQHDILGRRAGLTDEEIERVQAGPDASGWSAEDAALVQVADDLHAKTRIADTTWAALTPRYDSCQIMDMVFLVGCYDVLAMALGSFDIPLEPGVERFDRATRERMLSSTAVKRG
jgi:alkylhydroperoxidase family enzyme